MTNDNGRSLEEDVRQMTQENHAMLGEVYKIVKKIHHHMIWDQVMTLVKIALIVIPLVYAYLMFAPQLKQLMSMYSSLLGTGSTTEVSAPTQGYQLNQDALKSLSPEILNQLKKSGIIK
jgi:hypothetical protein